ncbi:MAG: MgtC/SapB family protein [Lachnospiraceae bacterium]|nr:MgtC/SapB family protein [Lachnospiraceae bacterium]
MQIHEVTYLAIVVRILAAVILGGIIGLERGLKNRPAGLRTYMLVCVGSCLIMLTNQYIYQMYNVGDPVRMGAQVVSGIGFLGAGTIVVTRRNQIKGLTTAAGLWAAAAVGLAVGIGLYEAAILGGATIFLVLSIIHRWDNNMRMHSKVVEAYVELNSKISLGDFMRKIREMDLEIDSIRTEYESTFEEGKHAYIVVLKSKQKRNHDLLFQSLRDIDGVSYVEGL